MRTRRCFRHTERPSRKKFNSQEELGGPKVYSPLLVLNRKVDIRVWVVITSWNPLKIYHYKECYVRFGCHDYDPSKPGDIYSHLTNNTVTSKCIRRIDNIKVLDKVPGNMWNLTQFKDFTLNSNTSGGRRPTSQNSVVYAKKLLQRELSRQLQMRGHSGRVACGVTMLFSCFAGGGGGGV